VSARTRAVKNEFAFWKSIFIQKEAQFPRLFTTHCVIIRVWGKGKSMLRLRQLFFIFVLSAVTGMYLNGTRIITGFSSREANYGYLSNFGYLGPENLWSRMLYRDHARWDSMEAYLSLSKEYDFQKSYGLLNAYGERSFHDRFSQTARNSVSSWQSYQVRSHSRVVSRWIEETLSLDELRDSPLALVGVLAAAYTGRTMRYRLTDEFAFESRSDFNGSQFDQQYFGWRAAPWRLTAGVWFAPNTSATTITVEKQLTSEVSVKYGHEHGGGVESNHSIGVNYSRGF